MAESGKKQNGLDASLDHRVMVWRKRGYVIWSLIGAAALVYLLGVVLNVLAVPVGIIIWAIFIFFVLRNQVDAMVDRGLNRGLSVFVAYIGLFVAAGLLAWLMFTPVFGVSSQFAGLVEGLPSLFSNVSSWVDAVYEQYPDIMQNPAVATALDNMKLSAGDWASDLAKHSLNSLLDVGSLTANIMVCVGFALVVAFWMLLAAPGIMREVSRLFGDKYAADLHFFEVSVVHVLSGYIRGTLLQCAMIGVACAIAYSIIGVPNAIALGIITGVLNVIPVVGPWIGGVVVAIGALPTSVVVAVASVVAAVVIQQVIYTFVSPKIMADSVDVHPAMIIIAMMIGYAVGGAMSGLVGGLVGMLLSIPLAALGKAVFVYYFERSTGRHLVASDGVFFRGVPEDLEVPNPEKDAAAKHPAVVAAKHRAETRNAKWKIPRKRH